MVLQRRLLKRFLKYAAISSQSREEDHVPSSDGQWELAKVLKEDLEALDFIDVTLSDKGVVIGHLPTRLNDERKVPVVGWVCHMDTVDVGLSPEIHPHVVHHYQGGDVVLNEDKQIIMKASDHPELKDYIGQDLVVSDGTSVLGADNKAAIANIMAALEIVKEEEREHGEIYVAFVPDEEIGLRGAKSMDLSLFPVDFAYTIDCCALGEVVYETFNAASAQLYIKGVTAHPMSAKNVLVNPILVGTDYIDLLNREETPECTENKEGFIWVTSFEGGEASAVLNFAIRDHDKKKFEAKKVHLKQCVEMIKDKYPKAELTLSIKDTYGNIADALTEDNQQAIHNLYEALKELNIEAKTIAMRGGTDGSYLSLKGIMTPNYFTGALNFHSNCEFIPMNSFEKSCLTTLKLIEIVIK